MEIRIDNQFGEILTRNISDWFVSLTLTQSNSNNLIGFDFICLHTIMAGVRRWISMSRWIAVTIFNEKMTHSSKWNRKHAKIPDETWANDIATRSQWNWLNKYGMFDVQQLFVSTQMMFTHSIWSAANSLSSKGIRWWFRNLQ